MMKFFATTVLVASLLSSPLFAQDRQSLARDYVALPAVQGMFTQMFSGDTMVEQMEANMGGITLSDTQRSKLSALMGNMMTELRPEIEGYMVESFSKIMTAEELAYMIEVYSTPLGASILSKTSAIMTDTQVSLGPLIMQRTMSLMPQIQEIMTGD